MNDDIKQIGIYIKTGDDEIIMTTSQIKVSVIIPVYNCPSLERAIESIPIHQEIEIIVIDGGSNQDIIDIIEAHQDKIDYYISEKDRGLYDAMNKGVLVARGEWIITLAADDQLICDPLSIIEKYDDEQCDLICGNIIAKDFWNYYFILGPEENLKMLLLRCSICHPGTFFRKTVYQRYGLYDLQYKCAADHELFLRIWKQKAQFKLIPDFIACFTYGGISTSNPFFAYREDMRISDQYGVSRFVSRAYYMKRLVKYYRVKMQGLLHLHRKARYMTSGRLKDTLERHPEVINSCFLRELG